VHKIVDHLAEHGDRPEQIVEYVAGMTDRFALAYAERL
jgi:dGTP triphosphohydrolase